MSRTEAPRRFWLFAPFVVLGVLFAAYSVYWMWMADALTKGVDAWIEDQRRLGYRMEHQGLDMRGFPYRFSLHVEAPMVEAPGGAWMWRTDTLRLSAMPYNLNHVIAQAPGEHGARTTDGRRFTARAPKAAGSLSWNSETLKRLSIVVPEAEIESEGSPYGRVSDFALHVSPTPDTPDDIRILVEAKRIELPAPPADAPWLGAEMGPLRAPIAVENGFEALAAYDPLQALNALDVRIKSPLASLDWGPVALRAKSDLGVDDDANLDGRLELRLENIEALEAALREAGALTPEVQGGLAAIKAFMGDDNFAPIDFEDGRIKLGMIPIGELEPLY